MIPRNPAFPGAAAPVASFGADFFTAAFFTTFFTAVFFIVFLAILFLRVPEHYLSPARMEIARGLPRCQTASSHRI
jgi:hypothetical protein